MVCGLHAVRGGAKHSLIYEADLLYQMVMVASKDGSSDDVYTGTLQRSGLFTDLQLVSSGSSLP
jgi:hypothetical protein